jgi:GntR family transcriptional regulator, transcriptional repressor for pyruvate dehydrogenase complex
VFDVTVLQPVEKQTLAKVVMQRLVTFIQSDALRPGDVLPSQHELARQLSVSRPVLREAMQGLASIGLVEIRPGSGCYVRDPNGLSDPDTLFEVLTHETALEVLEARMVVEVELAGFAAIRATDADFRLLEAILDRLKRAVARGHATAQITSDFHQTLSRAGHNVILTRMAQLLTRPRLAQGVRIEAALPDVTAGEYDSHLVLYEAVRGGDPEIAKRALRHHLEIAHGMEEQVASLKREIALDAAD